jgi:benzodiazapine receptor
LADLLSLAPFLVMVTLVGASGVMFMPGDWYKTLDKPSWTPPDWLFGPAWTALYLMIAVAGWLVWQADGIGLPLAAWAMNLVLNAAWSWLMFGRHRVMLALVDAAGMAATIVAFIWLALPHSPAAAALFIPYLAWTLFATALNAEILKRNPRYA